MAEKTYVRYKPRALPPSPRRPPNSPKRNAPAASPPWQTLEVGWRLIHDLIKRLYDGIEKLDSSGEAGGKTGVTLEEYSALRAGWRAAPAPLPPSSPSPPPPPPFTLARA